MLNAIPDTRNAMDMSEVFLAPNEELDSELRDDTEIEEKLPPHDTIDLGNRRKSSISSSKSGSSSSIEIPKRNSTVDMVESPIFEGIRLDAIKSRTPWLRLLAEYVAELFGTAILVLFGCSGIAQYTLSRGTLSSFLSVNFAFGFGALIAAYVAGPISGAHINPAVSIAMLSLRSITPLQCLTYTLSPTHSKGLEWNDINDFEDVCQTAEYLGKAMAKIHCISDIDSIEKEKHARHHTDLLPLDIIPTHTERTIQDAINGNDEAFIQDMVSFAIAYGNRVRRDHHLFFEGFRNEQVPILDMHQSQPKGHHHNSPHPHNTY